MIVETDDLGRTRKFTLFSCGRPWYMAFHFAWINFMIAFCAWFAMANLMPHIKEDLGLEGSEISNANIASVISTIIGRVFIGPLCDLLTAKYAMVLLITAGAIPVGLGGLIQNGTHLLLVRTATGLCGATFVPAQVWPSKMFSNQVVGRANAIVAGWGNSGVGFGFILLPLLAKLFEKMGMDEGWRGAMYVLAAVMIIITILTVLLSDGSPKKIERESSGFVEYVKSSMQVLKTTSGVMLSPACWILVFHYGCCFGAEITFNNNLNLYLFEQFGDKNSTVKEDRAFYEFEVTKDVASFLSGVYALSNLVTRPLGGYCSDVIYRYYSVPGRVALLAILLLAEGICLLAFMPLVTTIWPFIVSMMVFALTSQAAEGATYSIVPFFKPKHVGMASGLIGAGGACGGILFMLMIKAVEDSQLMEQKSLHIMGCIVIFSAFLCFFLKMPDHQFLHQIHLHRAENKSEDKDVEDYVSPPPEQNTKIPMSEVGEVHSF